MIEIPEDGAFLRVDGDGLEALVSNSPDVRASEARASDVAAAFREVRSEPLFWFQLVTAGTDAVLVHRGWVDDELMALQLAIDDGTWQVMIDTPDFLAVALARMVEVNPNLQHRDNPVPYVEADLEALTDPDAGIRRGALDAVGADLAWRLDCETDASAWHLTVVDGDAGPALYSHGELSFEPTTNTELFWLFATVREELMMP